MLLAPIVLHIVRDSRNHVLEATTTTTTRPKKRGGEGLRPAETHSERRGNTSVK